MPTASVWTAISLCQRCREDRDIKRGQKRQDALEAAVINEFAARPGRPQVRRSSRQPAWKSTICNWDIVQDRSSCWQGRWRTGMILPSKRSY